MPSAYQSRWPGDLEELRLGDVRGVDEGVAGLDVPRPASSPPSPCGRCRPWGGTRPGPSRSRRGSRRGPARCPASGGRAARPRRAGRGRRAARPWSATRCRRPAAAGGSSPTPRQYAAAERVSWKPLPMQAGAGQVRAAAQVLPDDLLGLAPGAPHVLVDRQPAEADLDRPRLVVAAGVALEPDQLELVRLVGQLGARLVLGEVPAPEGLALLDDPLIDLLERLEVLRGERGLDVEVVVEAVGDRRADAEPGARVDLLHRLREHVRGGVPQHGEAVGRVDRHRLDDRAVGERGGAGRAARRRPGRRRRPAGRRRGRPAVTGSTWLGDAVDGEGDELGHRYSSFMAARPGGGRLDVTGGEDDHRTSYTGQEGPAHWPTLLIEWAIPDSNR